MDMPLTSPDYKVVGTNDALVADVNAGIKALREGNAVEAITRLSRALAVNPTQPAIWMALAEAFIQAKNMAGAEEAAGYCYALEPRNIQAMLALSTAIAHQGRQAECLEILRRIAQIAPDFPGMQWNLALSEIAMGEWESGWGRYTWGRASGHRPKRHEMPVWDGDDIGDGVLYLYTEQGHGDLLWSLRFLKEARKRCPEATIYLEVPETWLFFLFAQPLVKRNGVRLVTVSPGGAFAVPCTAHASLWDIPTAIGLTPETVDRAPYLAADPRRVHAPLPPEHAGRPKVGIAWKGNPAHGADHWRSIHDLAVLRPILQTLNDRGVLVYSFIPGESPDATVFQPNLSRWEYTAAVLAQMDLLISVDTGVCHLAAALGVPTWVMMPRAVDYRWGAYGAPHLADQPRDHSLWYESMRIIRQEAQGEWSPVVERVVGAIASQWEPLTLAERFALPTPEPQTDLPDDPNNRSEAVIGKVAGLQVPVVLEVPAGVPQVPPSADTTMEPLPEVLV